jgi:RNA polymerase sigma factor (sigma-70 family)
MPDATLPPFQKLMDEYGSDVLGFLVASVGPHDAEDCFQETFVAALRSYERLDHASNLRGWLLTIAHRKAIDHHRGTARRPRPAGSADEIGRNLPARSSAGGAVADPEDELWQAVSVLPPKQRSAVVLRFATDMAYGQIGDMLDCSEAAARRSVHEGLTKLRGELA